MEPIFARYATRYAAQGFAVFPLAPNSKKPPHGSHGLLDATTDPRQITEWSRIMPAANIGLATGAISGVTVFDLDPLHGGFDSERNFAASGRRFPATAIARTRSAGRHVFCAYDKRCITGQNRVGPGIDIRNDGGYVVAGGSVVEGKRYQWLCWPKQGLAPVPTWIIQHIENERREKEAQQAARKPQVTVKAANVTDAQRRRYQGFAHRAIHGEAATVAAQSQPGRNTALFRATCLLGRWAANGIVSSEVIVSALTAAAHSNGLVKDNGLRDVLKTIQAGLRYSQNDDLPQLAERERRAA